jgi:hypothetical protein
MPLSYDTFMKPTQEDIIKYASQHTRLIVDVDCYGAPIEIIVQKQLNDGELFQAGIGWGVRWFKTNQVDILAMLPPPVPRPVPAFLYSKPEKKRRKKNDKSNP